MTCQSDTFGYNGFCYSIVYFFGGQYGSTGYRTRLHENLTVGNPSCAANIFRNTSNFRDPRTPFRKRARPENLHLPRPHIAAKIRIVRRTARTYRTFIHVSQKSLRKVSFRIMFYDGNAIP